MNREITVISPKDLSLPGLFDQRVQLSPHEDSYHFFEQQTVRWKTISWSRMEERVKL